MTPLVMNSNELLSILHEDIEDEYVRESVTVNHATSFLEESSSDEICFYNLQSTDLSECRFRKQLLVANAGIIAFNAKPCAELTRPYLLIRKTQWMEAQKKVCDHFYPLNLKSKKMIGVTGTNGKTTTVYLVLQVLKQIGEKGFSIGSLGVCDSERKLEDLRGMTTPPYVELRKILFRYFQDYDFCVMEVSSHALAQERVYKIRYDAAGWTSFGQDHLDYHKSLEDYFQQKLKLPKYYMKENKSLLISKKQKELAEKLSEVPIRWARELKSFGITEKTDFFNISFNEENLKMALTLVEESSEKDVAVNITEFTSPPGRFEILKVNDKCAIIDAAHTPDAMKGVLLEICRKFPAHKLITVFGCGGDRDVLKRPLMGQITEKYSEITIVTSDNPRSERPEDIIDDIILGMTGFGHRQADRSKAIALGVSLLTGQHLLVILGKGSETFQIIGSEKKEFSDRSEFYRYAGKDLEKKRL